jgi:hypothetical protein
MENISKMEMANALFNKPYIKTEKKFFGFKPMSPTPGRIRP